MKTFTIRFRHDKRDPLLHQEGRDIEETLTKMGIRIINVSRLGNIGMGEIQVAVPDVSVPGNLHKTLEEAGHELLEVVTDPKNEPLTATC